MRNIIVVLLFVLLLPNIVLADQDIVINQVLYDPINTDSGGEAIELYNPTEDPIDISGFVIKTKNSQEDAILPENTILLPKQMYLIADQGWDESKDNLLWRSADYEESLTLANSDAGIILLNGSIILDTVGWGNPPEDFFENIASEEVDEGNVLIRKNPNIDTNSNIDDFIESSPKFSNSDNVIDLEIRVIRENAQITLLNITSDSEESVQIVPIASDNRLIEFYIQVISDYDITQTNFNFEGYTSELENIRDDIYRGQFFISNAYPAGNYDLIISSLDSNSDIQELIVNIEYLSLTSLEIDTNLLNFNLAPGEDFIYLGDQNFNTNNISVKNSGNTKYNIILEGDGLSNLSNFYSFDSISYSVDYFNSNFKLNEPSDYVVEPGEIAPLSLAISIPADAKSGIYSGSILINARQSG